MNKDIEKPTVRMCYDTYSNLNSFIRNEMEKLKNNYVIALGYLSSEDAREEAYRIFIKEHNKFKLMHEELSACVKESYKNHPDEATRKFWGLE